MEGMGQDLLSVLPFLSTTKGQDFISSVIFDELFNGEDEPPAATKPCKEDTQIVKDDKTLCNSNGSLIKAKKIRSSKIAIKSTQKTNPVEDRSSAMLSPLPIESNQLPRGHIENKCNEVKYLDEKLPAPIALYPFKVPQLPMTRINQSETEPPPQIDHNCDFIELCVRMFSDDNTTRRETNLKKLDDHLDALQPDRIPSSWQPPALFSLPEASMSNQNVVPLSSLNPILTNTPVLNLSPTINEPDLIRLTIASLIGPQL